MQLFKPVLLAAIALSFTACTKGSDSRPAELAQAMKKAGNPNFNLLTKMLIHKHQVAFNASPLAKGNPAWTDADFEKAVTNLAPANLSQLTPWDLKLAIDKKLKEVNGGKDLIYNRNHVTIGSPLRLDRMQCYSGSILELLVTRQMNARDFQALNMVMILTPKHILPGFMQAEDENFRLIGVETTVIGRGRTDFGLTRDLNIPIRIVDAEAFVQMEVLGDLIDNKKDVSDWALKETAKLYNIPLDKTEALVASSNSPSDLEAMNNGQQPKAINASIFGFGSSTEDPPDGDIDRVERDEIPTTKGPITDNFIQSEESAPPKPAPESGAAYFAQVAPMPVLQYENPLSPVLHSLSQLVSNPTCAADGPMLQKKAKLFTDVNRLVNEVQSIPSAGLYDTDRAAIALQPLANKLGLSPNDFSHFTCTRVTDSQIDCSLGFGYGTQAGVSVILALNGHNILGLHIYEGSDAQFTYCNFPTLPDPASKDGSPPPDTFVYQCNYEGWNGHGISLALRDSTTNTTFKYFSSIENLRQPPQIQIDTKEGFKEYEEQRNGPSMCSPPVPGSKKEVFRNLT